MDSKVALVRRPSPRLAEGLVTHIERQDVDVDLARSQWEAYCTALESAGWRTFEVPPIDECPDGVFIEDTAVVSGGHAVVTRPGAPTRRPEVDGTREVLRSLGYELTEIDEPGTLDGGDVLKVGSLFYVGQGGRTNESGIEQLRQAFTPAGTTVRAVPTSLVLHLKSAVTALPDGTVIGYEPLVDDTSAFDSFLSVPEESGSHVVLLGENKLLVAASCPATHDLFDSMGFDLVVVDISEYEKLEGCVTCLSVRLRDLPPR
jgi:dimethylargininase